MSNVRQRSSKQTTNDVSNGHSHSHQHSKSKGVSSFIHTHSHEDESEEHTGEAMMLLDALRGRGKLTKRLSLDKCL
jgi:hypothetical protein